MNTIQINELAKDFGARVASRRTQQGLSQGDLAGYLGWTQQAISALEVGKRDCRISTLIKLAAVLKVHP